MKLSGRTLAKRISILLGTALGLVFLNQNCTPFKTEQLQNDIDLSSQNSVNGGVVPSPTPGGATPTPTPGGSNPTPTPTPTTGGAVNFNVKAVLATCNSATAPKSSALKLTNRMYILSLNQLLDDFSTNLKNDSQLKSQLAALPTDKVQKNKHARREDALATNLDMLSAYFESAYRAGALVAAEATGLKNYPNTNQCLSATSVTQACHQSFVKELGRKAFRRPLTTTEVTSISSKLYDSTLGKSDLIQLTFTSMVSMPDFLYRIYDHGPAGGPTATTLTMDQHELASKLSFLLTARAPDATLRAAAEAGTLSDANVLSQQVDRLIATPEGQENLKVFARESYGYDIFQDFTFPAAFLGTQSTTNLQPAMVDEMDQYFLSILSSSTAKFTDLMTSRQSNVGNAALAQLYGVSQTGLQTLPVERSGFLSRGAMLSKRPNYFASPVQRGFTTLENVLCLTVGNPPPNAPTSVPADPPGSPSYSSTRDRYHKAQMTAGTTCFGCHSQMNPLAYPFENFDSIGRVRTVETVFNPTDGTILARVPIRTDSDVYNLYTDSPVTVRDSVDFSQVVAASPGARACFVTHLREFEARTAASVQDGCHVNEAVNVISPNGTDGTSEASLRDVIKTYVKSTRFRYWTY